MTAANINFAAPTASSLPTLTASQPSASVQTGDQSFSRMLQSRENAPTPSQASQTAQAPAKSPSDKDPGKQPTNAKDASGTQDGKDQQPTADTPQETAQKAAQAAQSGLPKPSIKAGAGATGLTTNTDGDSTSTALAAQPDSSLLAAMAAANMAAQPASTAGKALPVELSGATSGTQTDQPGLLVEGQTEDAQSIKDLFQLASSAETSGKPGATSASTADAANFNAALNSAIDSQGGNPATPNPLGATMGTPGSQPTETTSRQVVTTPVATQGWAEEVGHKVSWAAGNGNGRAELILTPAHMGRIEVSINMNGDQASANFVAANAATREALQDAMPQLREVLAGAGIQLGQANVSANSGGQAWSGGAGQSGFNGGGSYASRNDDTGDIPIDALSGRSRGAWVLSGNGLVDTFA